MEASSFRYLSRLATKSVMPSWYMMEMSSAQSRVCISWTKYLIVEVIEFLVVNGEFMMTPRRLTWR